MLRRKLLAVSAALALLPLAFAQSPEGEWRGTFDTGVGELRLALDITKSDGAYAAKLNRLDQGASIPADTIHIDGNSLHAEFKRINGAIDAKFDAAFSTLTGTFTQGRAMPITLIRPSGEATAPRSAINVYVPVPPQPFPADGKLHLAYEIRIDNDGPADLTLKQIDVIGDAPLLKYEGGDLVRVIPSPKIGAGMHAIAYLWIDLAPKAIAPDRIRNRLVFDSREMEAFATVDKTPLPVLSPPLKGEGWFAANGPANFSSHRRASIMLDGKPWIAQRFAIDWVKRDESGATFKGDAKENATHFAYGAEALAVADSTVADTHDGVPQNVPGLNSRAVEITRETIGGNYVILDLGDHHFAFYAHLQPGSLRVKKGDRVKRGQVLGLVGNSGNSTEPHLHFHVMDRNSPLESEGLPYVLDSFEVLNRDTKKYEKREHELPLANQMVRFGN